MGLSRLTLNVTRRNRETDPEAIFRSLTLRGAVQNIWAPQADALKQWDAVRAERDIVIEMNTGGGKTLVCLLMAQSLVHETQGKVLYVCPTRQLVEQTAERARECGIEVATYLGGTGWSNRDAYDRAVAPCVTTYAALFTGFSTFRGHNLAATIFDDAHVAGDTVRDAFTLRVPPDHAAFKPVLNLFRSYFAKRFFAHSVDDVLAGDPLPLLFVPTHEVSRQVNAIRQLLENHGIADADATKFAWEHLRGHLNCCAFLISARGMEVSPPVLPVQTLPAFRGETRHIYATATLPAQTELIRTFGVSDFRHVVPGGKSGEAQRLFLFAEGPIDDLQRQWAKALVEPRKACVIAPAIKSEEDWCPPATRFETEHGDAGVRTFAQAKGPEKLLLAGRYDGIDLPGDACRVLVLDGLPEGASLFDRFMDQSLRAERLRMAHTARRVTQAIGRIFRSNTDHGAVLVCGNDLQRWLKDPANQRYLPGLLQRQVQFGIDLRQKIDDGETTADELLSALLTGDSDWDALYREHIGSYDHTPSEAEPSWLREYVARESKAFHALWTGQYLRAAGEYAGLADESASEDSSLSAWYRHWEGAAWSYAGEHVRAKQAFVLSANARAELGRPDGSVVATAPASGRRSEQSKKIAELVAASNRAKIERRLERLSTGLAYGEDTAPAEQALMELGEMIGLRGYRPDKDHGTGPDVFWEHEGKSQGAAIEAKTDKRPGGLYRKADIGQYHDSMQWVSAQFPEHFLKRIIVGRELGVTAESNPPDDLRIVPLEAFRDLLARAEKLYTLVLDSAAAGQEDLERIADQSLNQLGLKWPECVDALPGRLARDLRKDAPEADIKKQ